MRALYLEEHISGKPANEIRTIKRRKNADWLDANFLLGVSCFNYIIDVSRQHRT